MVDKENIAVYILTLIVVFVLGFKVSSLIGNNNVNVLVFDTKVNYTVDDITSDNIWDAAKEFCVMSCKQTYYKRYNTDTIEHNIHINITYQYNKTSNKGGFICLCTESPLIEMKTNETEGENSF